MDLKYKAESAGWRGFGLHDRGHVQNCTLVCIHVMKAQKASKEQLHSKLTSALDGSE